MFDEIALIIIKLVLPISQILVQVDLLCCPKTRFLFFIPFPNIMVFNWKYYESVFVFFQNGFDCCHNYFCFCYCVFMLRNQPYKSSLFLWKLKAIVFHNAVVFLTFVQFFPTKIKPHYFLKYCQSICCAGVYGITSDRNHF